jgi:hypothetical protein
MGLEVLGLDRSQAWDDALASHPASGLDVYFTSGYHRSHCLGQPEEARLLRFTRGQEQLVYPFRLRTIEKVGDEALAGADRDIESVYGFTGPLATTSDPAFLNEAWEAFSNWAAQESVVAEFVRFNPLLTTERFAPGEMSCERVRDHVVIDLTLEDERLWRESYGKTNRNMIRKAERLGLSVSFEPLEEHLDTFVCLYHETMGRNRAAQEYYFDGAHFAALARESPAIAAVARRQGRDLAVSLFLVGPNWMHYHLSGCSEEGLDAAANNLILHRAVGEARRLGLSLLHLGGGRTGSPEDLLLRFKAGFSPLRRPVLVGRRVHRRDRYEELCALRRAQVSTLPAGYFLGYRYEPRPPS